MADCINSEKICQPCGVIYKITNLLNGKIYVGQTTQKLSVRMAKHRYNKEFNSAIDQAIQKYGWENFSHEEIETCSVDMLNEREMFWIKELNSKAPNGYNLTDGGEGSRGFKHTPEAREKISAAKKGKSHAPHSPETRKKISSSLKGRVAPNKGKSLSAEHRAKISESRKAYWAAKKNLETNEDA